MSESIQIALIGLSGVVVGSIATASVQLIKYWLDECSKAKRDKPRKELLEQMLKHEGNKWRKFDTLKHVIGADEETTKRLLLEVGARASEDGQPLWGLVSRNPLPQADHIKLPSVGTNNVP